MLPLPEESGWILNDDGTYAIDWEDRATMKEISNTIDQMMHGCKCKKGCSTSKCGCKKKSSHCGPGCYCINCSNIPESQQSTHESSESESDSDISCDSNEELEMEIITDSNFMYDDYFTM